MKYKIYKLEATFIGYEGKSETMVNGQPEYAAVYTAYVEIFAGTMIFAQPIKGRYYDEKDKSWKDTKEDQEDLKRMISDAIRAGEAEEI